MDMYFINNITYLILWGELIFNVINVIYNERDANLRLTLGQKINPCL